MKEALPLVGVLLGVLMSWVTSTLTENRRFQREQTRHWLERRLATYTEFAATTKNAMSILFRVAAGMGLDQQTDPLELSDALPMFASAFHDREVAFERMRMVGSKPAEAAARAWVQNIYVMREALKEPGLDAQQWSELVGQANRTREAFYEVTRRDLGVDTL